MRVNFYCLDCGTRTTKEENDKRTLCRTCLKEKFESYPERGYPL